MVHYNTENMETYGPTLSFKNRKALLMAIAPSAPPKNLEPVSPWLPPLPEKSRASAPELSSFLSLGWDPWRRRGSCSPHLDPAPIDPSLVGWDLLGNDRSDNRPLPALTWSAARTSGSRGRVAARFGRPRLGPPPPRRCSTRPAAPRTSSRRRSDPSRRPSRTPSSRRPTSTRSLLVGSSTRFPKVPAAAPGAPRRRLGLGNMRLDAVARRAGASAGGLRRRAR